MIIPADVMLVLIQSNTFLKGHGWYPESPLQDTDIAASGRRADREAQATACGPDIRCPCTRQTGCRPIEAEAYHRAGASVWQHPEVSSSSSSSVSHRARFYRPCPTAYVRCRAKQLDQREVTNALQHNVMGRKNVEAAINTLGLQAEDNALTTTQVRCQPQAALSSTQCVCYCRELKKKLPAVWPVIHPLGGDRR